ncbi:DUF2621 domain-containing protein [Paenibacillus chitinolyticus]|uniref:DUF2621 domain-containing protein n=2 Tax=Paenibacillus chitinolyticus TaxID=79263 RepID=A0A410WS17_9BACL|nr:hypothetical protein HMPREF9413_4689 [Paenibacillus sp. HGF7]EPD82543.1 hypothetical protein HMPREF1207_03335 [Paenibacillus sp. HGH0039]QAV17165.1 DUF2621 domain-containing protein [Paenibacillus chitinolyticus]GKS10536.1 hypothetical protein YDYSY3_15360 [Paenibacillus chitinolyticus]SEF81252.1 Protein of unknown function [Paenibacillus sp. UNC499MF]
MNNSLFMWFITFWPLVLIGLMAIGGYFMFRKFLKVLPKADGKSKLDWQNYYVEKSRHMWTDDSKAFLNKLVAPVPGPFRDIAKHSIAAKIGQIALEEEAAEVTREHCIKGYIIATPKRDYRSLMNFLEREKIDYTPYKHLINS